MNRSQIAGALLLLAATLAIEFVAPPWSHAQIVAPDQNMGSQSERTAPLAEGVIVIPNDEPTTKGLDQGFERPLTVPDRMMDGDHTRLPLRTPDQADAESVRESDARSALGF